MTPVQCRMSRAALKWSTADLAAAAKVNSTTVNRFENGKDAYTSTASKLEAAFTVTGQIRFEGNDAVFYLGDEIDLSGAALKRK